MAAIPITLEWHRYDNFFCLWRAHGTDRPLIYVIGDEHHCYVGSIGSREGRRGLAMRYQWQYVHRARAIFGLEEAAGQPAYVALFGAQEVTARDIVGAEAYVQHSFIARFGIDHALFEPEDIEEDLTFANVGHPPRFLYAP